MIADNLDITQTDVTLGIDKLGAQFIVEAAIFLAGLGKAEMGCIGVGAAPCLLVIVVFLVDAAEGVDVGRRLAIK